MVMNSISLKDDTLSNLESLNTDLIHVSTEQQILKQIENTPFSKIGFASDEINKNTQNMLSSFERTLKSKTFRDNSSPNFIQSQKSVDINALITDSTLNSIITKNPWIYSIKKTLNELQNRLYDNSLIKFRVGGRAIYSAAQIVSAKSTNIIQESFDTKEQLQEHEIDADDLGSSENDEIVDSSDNIHENTRNGEISAQELPNFVESHPTKDTKNVSRSNAISIDLNNDITDLDEIDEEFNLGVSTDAFYNVDASGEKYLAAPIRKVYKKIGFADLGYALNKIFLNQSLEKVFKNQSKNQIPSINSILPQKLLKNGEEERALVEAQIQKMFTNICTKYDTLHAPVPLLSILIAKDRAGIVHTLLYLLHLVNRKKIELYQEFDDDNPQVSCLNIFTLPIKTN